MREFRFLTKLFSKGAGKLGDALKGQTSILALTRSICDARSLLYVVFVVNVTVMGRCCCQKVGFLMKKALRRAHHCRYAHGWRMAKDMVPNMANEKRLQRGESNVSRDY